MDDGDAGFGGGGFGGFPFGGFGGMPGGSFGGVCGRGSERGMPMPAALIQLAACAKVVAYLRLPCSRLAGKAAVAASWPGLAWHASELRHVRSCNCCTFPGRFTRAWTAQPSVAGGASWGRVG